MIRTPLTNGCNGDRDSVTGRFVKGNRAGRGNPHAQAVGRLRSALLRAVTSEDIQGVVQALLDKARQGDTAAAKVLLDYTIGRPVATVMGESSDAPLVKVIRGVDLDAL
jgi:hypothetical protein